MNRSTDVGEPRPQTPSRGPLTALLGLFSSVWFGVFLLVLLFIYSSLGSALPPLRQHRFLEMTEFEWFHWWPFDVLIALFAITLAVATVRRIPLRRVNAGVWMIHTGILILCAGSVYYFGTKVEGDVPVFRRRVVVEVPGAKQARHLLVRPGNRLTVDGLGGDYQFEIAGIDPNWVVPDAALQDQTAYRVSVAYQTPLGRSVRHLVSGLPQYNEEISQPEGDIRISLAGEDAAATLSVRAGGRSTLQSADGEYVFQIANIQPDWPILTGDDAGKRAFSVSVMVSTPRQEQFIRQLLAGYPQYTEDIIPGKGRAVKAVGKKLLDENLQLSLELRHEGRITGPMVQSQPVKLTLDYEPQDHFYLQDSSALYLRPAGGGQWTPRPIDGVPHYHERFASRDNIWAPDDMSLPVHPLDLTVPAAGPDDPFADLRIRVTGYLRYAFERSRWVDGGQRPNPVIGVQLHTPDHRSHSTELAAFDRRSSRAADGQLAFLWAESPQQLQDLTRAGEAYLDIEVPGHDLSLRRPLGELLSATREPAFQRLEETEYEFRVRNRVDNLALNDGRVISVLLVDIRTPQGTFTRMVADDPQSTRDMSEEPGHSGHHAVEPDPAIVMKYQPSELAPITVVGGPDDVGLNLVMADQDGPRTRALQIGEQVVLPGGGHLQITHFYPRARLEVRPWVVPLYERQRDARKAFSMIRVSFEKDDWQHSMWLPFNYYAFESPQYHIPGQIGYEPRELGLPDGRRMELMYSRQRHPLPAPVALERFTLLTHQGGLIGRNSNVRDYISQLRFAQADGGWSEPVPMSLNNPANLEGFWFFQSTWDPPSAQSAGMNYTGLGVGNRNGVYIQLAGTAIAVLGMIFAFYVKPIIIRRRRLEVQARLEHEQKSQAGTPPGPGIEENAHLEPATAVEEQRV